ncbi:MAG: FkbM family methyltransferase [Rickettsiales bacterium]|nr:FkbM family methyltransferase [Rickettsiales bacterium]
MATILHTSCAKTHGGSFNERLAMKLLWLASWLFVPIAFRGFWRVTRPILTLFGVKSRQWVQLKSGLRLSVDMADPYWNRLISPCFDYEPELDYLLSKLNDYDYHFIDCGANMGFWSCMVASAKYGAKPVISVEPLQDNFKLLASHVKENNLQAALHQNAVSQKAGEELTLYKPGGHASVSLVVGAEVEGAHKEQVTTVTIDSITEEARKNQANFVLKLDVEGVEVEALKGAGEFLKTNPIIFYEDHAEDSTSKVTDYILNDLGCIVYHITDDHKVLPVETVEQANKLKTDSTRGYNFMAFKLGCKMAEIVLK